MKRFVSFNLWEPANEDWEYMQSSYDSELRLRWTDTHTWGILRDNSYPAVVNIPVSAINLTPPRWPNILAAPVSLNVATGLVSVGAGSSTVSDPKVAGLAAYDLYGQRIAILDDVPFDFDNDSPYGLKSSGNLDIPLTTTGSGGDCSVNPSIPGTYYLWAEYLEINESQAIIGEDGSTHYPQVDDGYRIRITDVPIAPSGDGVSVFLAKVIWIGGSGTLTATDGNISDSSGNAVETKPGAAGDPHRVWAGKRPQHVEIVVDEANRTPSYGLAEGGVVLSLHDHVNALGAGLPTHNNPHALALSDIPGAGAEPIATLNQRDALAKGLVDLNAPQNSPARLGDVAMPIAFNNALAPTALDPAANAAGISTNLQQAFVRILDFDTDARMKAAFLLGFRLTQLYPTMVQTTSHNSVPSPPYSINDGWVGFELAPAGQTGVYRIYGKRAELADGTAVLLLNKQLLATDLTFPIPPPDDDMIVLGQVYWDATAGNIYKNPVQPPPTVAPGQEGLPDDQRSLGLVGPQQLSTELKNDPDTGGLSQQVFENQAANSNYALGTTNVTEDNFGLGFPISSGAPITAGTDPTLASQGPAAVTGRRWTLNAAGVGISGIFHLLKNLKPGRMYGLSFWYKANSAFNARVRVGLADSNLMTFNSLISLDGSVSVPPLDYTIRNDSVWHRASIVLQTLSDATAVNPDPASLKYLVFQVQPGGPVLTAGQLSLTNIQLTEGEWIPGYMGSKYVPSGGIIMWDYSDNCPAGYQEITALQGRFPVGAYAPIPIPSQSASQLNPGAPAITTSINGNHVHLPNNPGEAGASKNVIETVGGPGVVFTTVNVSALNHQHDYTGGGSLFTTDGNHAHTVDGGLPYYALKFCRAI